MINRLASAYRSTIVLYGRGLKLIWNCDPKGTILYFGIVATLGLIPPIQVYLSKSIIDQIISAIQTTRSGHPLSLNNIYLILAIQSILWIIGGLFNRVLDVMRGIQSSKLQHYIDRLCLWKISSLDIAFFESSEFFNKIQRAQSQASVSSQRFLMFLMGFIQEIVTVVSMLYIIWNMNPLFMIILLVLSMPYVYTSGYFAKKRVGLRQGRAGDLRMVNYVGSLLNSRDTIKEIKLFGLRPTLFQRFDNLWNLFITQDKDLSITEQCTQMGLHCLSLIGILCVWVYAIGKTLIGQLTIGSLTMVLQAAKSASDSLAHLFGVGGAFYESSLFLKDLFVLLDLDPSSVPGTLSPNPLDKPISIPDDMGINIEFRNVSFGYPETDHQVLRNLSFSIANGERIALVGENGAGKTTIIKLLTRLYDPTEGEIFINGHNIIEYNEEELRQKTGVLFQDFVRYQFSVSDNIGFGRVDMIDDQLRIKQMADKADCMDMINKLPNGFQTILGRTLKDGVDISGGEWQKIALARAFMRDPDVLILDEPTASLDPLSEEKVFISISDLMRNKSCVVVSHRFSTVRSMDRILVLEHGEIIEEGTHKDLMAIEGKYASMYSTQASRYIDSTEETKEQVTQS